MTWTWFRYMSALVVALLLGVAVVYVHIEALHWWFAAVYTIAAVVALSAIAEKLEELNNARRNDFG